MVSTSWRAFGWFLGVALAPGLARASDVVGSVLPPLGLSPRTDFGWTAPRAPTAVAFGGAMGADPARAASQAVGRVLAQTSWRRVSFDGRVASPIAGASARYGVGPTTWLGLRAVLGERDDASWTSGLYVRQGIPAQDGSRPQLDLGGAFGGTVAPLTWLVNVGMRAREGEVTRQSWDELTPHVVAGVGVTPTEWLRFIAVGHVAAHFVGPEVDEFVGSSERGLQFGAAAHVGAEVRASWFLAALHGFGGGLAYPNGGDSENAVGAQAWVGYTLP